MWKKLSVKPTYRFPNCQIIAVTLVVMPWNQSFDYGSIFGAKYFNLKLKKYSFAISYFRDWCIDYRYCRYITVQWYPHTTQRTKALHMHASIMKTLVLSKQFSSTFDIIPFDWLSAENLILFSSLIILLVQQQYNTLRANTNRRSDGVKKHLIGDNARSYFYIYTRQKSSTES